MNYVLLPHLAGLLKDLQDPCLVKKKKQEVERKVAWSFRKEFSLVNIIRNYYVTKNMQLLLLIEKYERSRKLNGTSRLLC